MSTQASQPDTERMPTGGLLYTFRYGEFADEFRRGTHLPDGASSPNRKSNRDGQRYLQTMDGDPERWRLVLLGSGGSTAGRG